MSTHPRIVAVIDARIRVAAKRAADPTYERKRSPLPYFTEQQERAKFDPWKGYAVSHLTSEYIAPPFAGLSLDAPEQFRAPRSI